MRSPKISLPDEDYSEGVHMLPDYTYVLFLMKIISNLQPYYFIVLIKVSFKIIPMN
jgi:hypothetical protein